MGSIAVELPPPAYWQDFEKITLQMCRLIWRDDYAQHNGRSGQRQSGVDVFGQNYPGREYTGVQCKKRKNKSNGFFVPSASLTIDEIDIEINLARNFRPVLERFIIATTGARDAELQEHVRLYNSIGQLPKITIWFWDDYVDYLEQNENLLYRYYEHILRARERYKQGEHYLRLLALPFDRPAMRTAFHLENRAIDFIEAIKLLQQVVSTGILKDQDGYLIDQVPVPNTLPEEIKGIKTLLALIRRIATKALAEGRIIEHVSVIEILDRDLVENINLIRREIIDNLNAMLQKARIEAVEIREY